MTMAEWVGKTQKKGSDGDPAEPFWENPGKDLGQGKQFGFELILGDIRSDDLVFHFAVLEEKEEWDRADVVFHCEISCIIHVDLGNLRLAIDLAGELVKDGADHFARAAPFRPEIDEDGLVGV